MYFKHIILVSSLAFWSSPVVAQADLGGLSPIEKGTLLGKQWEKIARRERVKRSTTSNDQIRDDKGPAVLESPDVNERQLDGLLGDIMPELAPSSSNAASATPTPSIIPYYPFMKRDETPNPAPVYDTDALPTERPSSKITKKQLGGLGSL